MLFAVKNPHIYQPNSTVNGTNTRQQNKPQMFSGKTFFNAESCLLLIR